MVVETKNTTKALYPELNDKIRLQLGYFMYLNPLIHKSNSEYKSGNITRRNDHDQEGVQTPDAIDQGRYV